MINIVYTDLSSLTATSQIRKALSDGIVLNVIFCNNKENISLEKSFNKFKNGISKQFNIYVTNKSNAANLVLVGILKMIEKYSNTVHVYRTSGHRVHKQHSIKNTQFLKEVEFDVLNKSIPLYSKSAIDFLRIQRNLEIEKNEVIYDLSEGSCQDIIKSHSCHGAKACVILLSTQVDIAPEKFLMCNQVHIYSPDKHDLYILTHLVSANKVIYGKKGPQRFAINFYEKLGINLYDQT
jgi:hypothetical protein